ncbi:Response regulator receiver domain-containing protein [Chryseolinea serpens]|uniref:Response regulator receiver domain-containing protein n=1 Tax=Chryseolinea serpens TaxID=947013 RepID=A0A1M5MMB5_9BACT|nr:response regulator [Chryseolinea serpens]SHG78448.1 Response regulator receiver domain-containing protein [Chryseolinea serpens]
MQAGNIILAIDDDPDDLELLVSALENDNVDITCMTAKNAKDGLKLLWSLDRLPKIIFLDCNMPGISGKECLIEIRNDIRSRDVPVVMYSTFATESDMEFFRKWNASFMKKHTDFASMKSDIMLTIEAYLMNIRNYHERSGKR